MHKDLNTNMILLRWYNILVDKMPLYKEYEFTHTDVKFYDGAMVINWACKGMGFGQFTVALQPDRFLIDSERMSADFVACLLRHCRQQILDHLEIT